MIDREDEVITEPLRRWIVDQDVGTMRPVEVRKREKRTHFGQEAWFFDVVLPDPEPASGEWPVEGLIRSDLAMRDEAIRQRLSWPWYLSFVPVTDEPQEDEDAIPAAG